MIKNKNPKKTKRWVAKLIESGSIQIVDNEDFASNILTQLRKDGLGNDYSRKTKKSKDLHYTITISKVVA